MAKALGGDMVLGKEVYNEVVSMSDYSNGIDGVVLSDDVDLGDARVVSDVSEKKGLGYVIGRVAGYVGVAGIVSAMLVGGGKIDATDSMLFNAIKGFNPDAYVSGNAVPGVEADGSVKSLEDAVEAESFIGRRPEEKDMTMQEIADKNYADFYSTFKSGGVLRFGSVDFLLNYDENGDEVLSYFLDLGFWGEVGYGINDPVHVLDYKIVSVDEKKKNSQVFNLSVGEGYDEKLKISLDDIFTMEFCIPGMFVSESKRIVCWNSFNTIVEREGEWIEKPKIYNNQELLPQYSPKKNNVVLRDGKIIDYPMY